MLAVSQDYRRRGIGKALVHRVLARMKDLNCASATLETEVTNTTAQRLYQDCFGFIREELLVRYYLNWNDAYRLRLWFDWMTIFYVEGDYTPTNKMRCTEICSLY